jgi:hypothetical protein
MEYPSPDEPESDAQPRDGPQQPARWQFSLGALFKLTAGVAVACSLFTWWGLGGVVAMLGAAAGAFAGATVCPWIGLGFDRVLDKPGPDLLRCLGVGVYVAAGIWVANAGFPWASVWSRPFGFFSGALLVFFAPTVIFVAKALWPDIEVLEAVTVAAGAVIGVVVTLSLFG